MKLLVMKAEIASVILGIVFELFQLPGCGQRKRKNVGRSKPQTPPRQPPTHSTTSSSEVESTISPTPMATVSPPSTPPLQSITAISQEAGTTLLQEAGSSTLPEPEPEPEPTRTFIPTEQNPPQVETVRPANDYCSFSAQAPDSLPTVFDPVSVGMSDYDDSPPIVPVFGDETSRERISAFQSGLSICRHYHYLLELNDERTTLDAFCKVRMVTLADLKIKCALVMGVGGFIPATRRMFDTVAEQLLLPEMNLFKRTDAVGSERFFFNEDAQSDLDLKWYAFVGRMAGMALKDFRTGVLFRIPFSDFV